MRAAVACLFVLALVAGCGGDDDEDTVVEATTVTTTETVPTTTPAEPVATVPGPDVEDEDATGADNGAAQAPSKCGRIAFNPSTDSGAAGITAVGTDCETARALARASRNATDDLIYDAEGFHCAGARSEKAGLSSIDWLCVGAEREVVSFATT